MEEKGHAKRGVNEGGGGTPKNCGDKDEELYIKKRHAIIEEEKQEEIKEDLDFLIYILIFVIVIAGIALIMMMIERYR